MEEEFEKYWKKHRDSLVQIAPQNLKEERKASSKMNTAGDWLLLVIPIVVFLWVSDSGPMDSILGNFLIALGCFLVAFYLTILAKPYVTGKRNVTEIDINIQKHFYQIYQKGGLGALDELRN